MDHQIAKRPIKKVFTSTSGNVYNKTENTNDFKLEQHDIIYKSRDMNDRQQNSYGGFFDWNNQHFKNKNYNRKTNPLNNKGKISRCNFCRSKFHQEKNCADAAEKSNNGLWLSEELNIAFSENSAESLA